MSNKFFIIDGHSQLYQAYYAITKLTSPAGQPVNAVYGFTRMLRKIIREFNPYYMVVTFDTKGPTFRHLEYKEYKANRKPAPEEFISQLPLVSEIIDAYNIPLYSKEGYEADDLIGTIAKKVASMGIECIIITIDKDMEQLVDDNIKIYNPRKKATIGLEEIRNERGIEPESLIDVLGLGGDASDNIPGIPGIGYKTALNLIKEWKTVENVLSNIDKINGKKKQENLLKYAESARMSKRLATIDINVPLDVNLEACRLINFDNTRLKELFTKYDFKSFLAEMA